MPIDEDFQQAIDSISYVAEEQHRVNLNVIRDHLESLDVAIGQLSALQALRIAGQAAAEESAAKNPTVTT